MVEVEAQTVGFNQGAGLFDVCAEHFLQRPMEEVGSGVVVGDPLAPLVIDLRGDGVLPLSSVPFSSVPRMDDHVGIGGFAVGDDKTGVRWNRSPVSATWPPFSA